MTQRRALDLADRASDWGLRAADPAAAGTRARPARPQHGRLARSPRGGILDRLAGGLLLFAALAAGGSCAGAAEPPKSGPVRGGTFILAIEPEPAQLHNAFHNQYANTAVGVNIFDGLVVYGNDQKPEPLLATDWSVAPDGRAITLHLRRGVKWHDGVPFTSADVRYSVLEVWKKVHPRARVTFAPVVDVETPDDHTAILRLDRPAPVILNSLGFAEAPILPRHIYEGTDVRTNPANQKPVGTGAFRFVQWKKGQYIELERNPDYWDQGKPYLDRVIFRNIPDAPGRAAALETGEILYLPYSGVPFSDVERLKKEPSLAFEDRGYSYNAQIYFVEFNLRRPIVQQQKVRQAIGHAINRKGLVDTVFYGVTDPVDGPIPPGLPAFYTKDKPAYAYDPARAEKLLDEAGLPRKADGKRFSLTLDLSPSNDAFVQAGEYIRQNLAKVGIDLRPISSDAPTYLKKIFTNYDFDLLIQGYSVLQDPEMGLTRVVWSKAVSPGVPYVNASGYASAETDRIIDAYRTELDPEKRVALFHDLQRQINTDLPLLAIMNAPFFTFYNKRVHGLDTRPDGARGSFRDVWIEP